MSRIEKLFHGVGFLAWMVSLCELLSWQIVFSIRMSVNVLVLIFGIFVLGGIYINSKDRNV